MDTLDTLEQAKIIGKAISDKKGEDVVLIDIGKISSFADYFVNATATNSRMADSLLDAVSDAADKIGIEPKNIEGKPASGWVLADYGDIIVNVFLAEQRATYRLEKIWSDGEFIEVE